MNRVDKTRQLFSFPEYYSKEHLLEMDQESNCSSTEDVESPRSVAVAHSQITRIRTEDLQLPDDVAEGRLFLKDKFGRARYVVFSRPILPASPLSRKSAH